MKRFLVALASVLLLSTAAPAAALTPVEPAPPKGGAASTQAVESFSVLRQGAPGVGGYACWMRLTGQDYGSYVVLSDIDLLGYTTLVGSAQNYTNLGLTVRNSSGTILKSNGASWLEDTWWDAGAPPAGSIGDGGQLRMTGTWHRGTCSLLVYTASL